jgi:hypothetical protein
MAEAAVQEEQRPSIATTLCRFLLMYMVLQSVIGYFWAKPSQGDKNIQPVTAYMNEIREHTTFNLVVWLHTDEEQVQNSGEIVWQEAGFTYDYNSTNFRNTELNYTLTPALQQNGTLFLTAKITFKGRKMGDLTISDTISVTRYKETIQESSVSLLSGEAQAEVKGTGNFSMHWVPSLDFYLLYDDITYGANAVPPQLRRLKFNRSQFTYEPLFYISDFWLLRDMLIPLNSSISEVPFRLSFSVVGLFKHSFMEQFSMSNDMLAGYGMSSEGEFEIMKRMFLEANPIFLGITMCVSLLHTVFEFMAFKSDIEFWKTRKTLKGLSTKLLLYNFVSTLVISLYLLDSQETSYLVLVPMLLSVFLEFWKLSKGFDIGISTVYPFISFKEKESHKEGGTDMYDNLATRYLGYLLLPLVLGYSMYSLYYDAYKSWYSFVLRSLARFIYTTGFIMMTPQLYINYKLKSVEHMPWKVLTYKALNTFIDDMFAFIISMPTMHRIACFRDDIIFVIYVYQRYAYRVDPNRHYLETQAEVTTHPKAD